MLWRGATWQVGVTLKRDSRPCGGGLSWSTIRGESIQNRARRNGLHAASTVGLNFSGTLYPIDGDQTTIEDVPLACFFCQQTSS